MSIIPAMPRFEPARRSVRFAAPLRLTPAVAAFVAACAVAPEPEPAGPRELGVRQTALECAAEKYPERLPVVAALLDTALLNPALQATEEGERISEVVLSLWYEPDGTNTRREVIAHSGSPGAADSIQKLVFSALRPGPELGRPWGARLHVLSGPQPSYHLARREYCPPRPLSRELLAAMNSYQGTVVHTRRGQRERVELVDVTVHPTGYVEYAEFSRAAIRGSSRERELRDAVRHYAFAPATMDGIAVRGEIRVPLRVRH